MTITLGEVTKTTAIRVTRIQLAAPAVMSKCTDYLKRPVAMERGFTTKDFTALPPIVQRIAPAITARLLRSG